VVLIILGLDAEVDPVPPTIFVLCLLFLWHEVRHDLFEVQIRRWKQLFLGVDEAAFLTDRAGEVVCANGPASRFLSATGSGTRLPDLPPTVVLGEGPGARWFTASRNVYDTRRRLTSWLLIDVTDQRKAEEALRASEEKYRRLVENSRDIVYTLDGTGVFRFVSPAWTTLLGHPVSEVVGRSFAPFVHPDDAPACRAFLGRIVESGQPEGGIEYRVRHADGRWVWHSSTAGPLRDAGGRVIGLEGTARDISQKKEDEARIQALLAEKDLILREVHHRIKNNMGNIMGILTLHAMELGEPAAVRALEDASSRVQSMMVLYDKLYQSEDYVGVSTSEYFSTLVDEILANFARVRTVEVEKTIEDFLLPDKKIQPLGIIINELLTNVMKYAFTGRPGGKVWISLVRTGTGGRLTIQDDGNGMPETVDFERSTGFGLRLLATLTQHLGGRIGIDRNQGTKVTLEFPV
jgi:PAS domain S-box-containing protein